jgi:DNA-binding GntR family transcriptional regulator
VARHTLIVDAIEARDPHLAARAMLRAVDGGFVNAKRARSRATGRP